MQRWGMTEADASDAPFAGDDRVGGNASRVLGAMANAGLRLLGEELAARPSDIDVAMVLGHGLPRRIGGPMHWAHRRGLLVLREDLRRWAQDAPDLWTPAPLLDRLIEEGITLAMLNEA